MRRQIALGMISFFGIVLLCSLVVPQQPRGQFVVSFWQSAASGWKPDTLDRGIGILTFAQSPGGPANRRDTLFLRLRPEQRAGVNGLFIYIGQHAGYGYAVAGRDSLQPNMLEFDHEEVGIPFEAFSPDHHWAKAILGFRKKNGTKGWINLDSTLVRCILWKDTLPKKTVFFLPEYDPEYYDRPDGAKLKWTLSSLMRPLQVRGRWMRVQRIPQGQMYVNLPVVESETAWIQFLNRKGRPMVWYYTRD